MTAQEKNLVRRAEKFDNANAYAHDQTRQRRFERRFFSLDRPDAAQVPIIAMTANAFDEDVQRSLQAGMNAHLTKPVDADHLFQTLGELIYEAEH